MKPARLLPLLLAVSCVNAWAAPGAEEPADRGQMAPPNQRIAPADSPSPTSGEMPLTLPEAFRLALRRSETIAESKESAAEALARVDELKSAILPHASLLGSETLQENPNIPGLSSIDVNRIPLVQITATQPLFSGFREFLAFKMGKAQAKSADLDERRAESLLYQDVAQAYLTLLQMQREILIRQSIIEATRERIDQLNRWVQIGRSRDSEVLAARSQMAQVEAQLEIARGQERYNQEVLKFLTGLESEDRLVPADLPLPALDPLDPFLQMTQHRSDVEARRKNVESAQLDTKINERQRWPTIGLTGDYYLKRSGFSGNTHYDAIFAGSLPLFEGGQFTAQVHEAQARERSSLQALSLALRGAERDVRSAYRSLEWTLAAARALDKAAELGQANVRAQAEDYRRGMVTNLDVLDAITTLETTKLLLNQTQLQAVLARVQLEVAAGAPAP